MNRKKAVITTIAALCIPFLSIAKTDLTIKFSECFLKYDTVNGKTEIILYNTRPSQKTTITPDLFKNAFNLSEFEIKELVSSEPGSNPPTIKVLAQTTNFMMNTPAQQLFSNILNTEAKVHLSMTPPNMKMSVLFPMQKNMYVADNNALQALQNEKEFLLEFDFSDFPSKPLEVVIGWKEKETLTEKMDKDYQHDADIFRLRHMKYFVALIEEYHKKTGQYPLQGKSETQHYVFIAAPHQEKYVQGVPEEFEITKLEEFRKTLETELERIVEFKFDPQKVSAGAPNFYIYMVEEDSFFFAVHLYNQRSFTYPFGEHYNKLEITNEEPTRRGLWKLDDLLQDNDFQKAMDEKPHKEGFFLDLEKQYK